MKHKKLAGYLNIQINFLFELLSVIKNLQESLVNNDHDSLEDSVRKEEELFKEISQNQSLIFDEIKTIAGQEKLELKENKLSELIRHYSGNDKTELLNLATAQKNIISIVNEIGRINLQNRILIDHSRELIKGIITAAVSNSDPGGQGKNIIFDRRI